MLQSARTRDVLILFKGDAYPVTIDATMALGGWKGGQGVKWVESSKDELCVTYSDGYYAGFLLWGSDESSDKFVASTGNQPAYRFATIGAGGWLIVTSTFERYTWESRQAGSLVEIVYKAGDRLLFSNRGYFTTQDEWSLSDDPRKPNAYFIAYVAQPPTDANNHYMTVQTSI
jgi:hypothetical protein